ncbi:hypothetical protein LTS18_011461 [Coniosporium uncinatum]|uniref:Uncharacterized protein n=1 Tax=Coniosporium uncinatum TaxID=93489 RepID=A0ACC3CYG7_9PEZI|nr:hypothetical protein LTS18_011461 [Coniosporium uncinatum]
MAGISFLYAIWHSPVVRSHLSLDDVDFTVLAATSVLGDLMDKCPPAEACRDAFDRMSKATIQMCLSTTGFGPQAASLSSRAQVKREPLTSPTPTMSAIDPALESNSLTHQQRSFFASIQNSRVPIPRFDMNLRDLFSDEETDFRSFDRPSSQIQSNRPPNQQLAPTSMGPPPLQQQHSYDGISSSHSQPNISPYQISNQLPYQNLAQSVQSTYPSFESFNDLNFLDSFSVNGGGSGVGNASNAPASNGTEPADFNLFGMGWEGGNHDWADGNGVDLFDGFFFGGNIV